MKRYKGLGRVFSFTLTQQLRQRGWRTATIAVALACLLIPILSLTVAAQHQKNAAPEQNPVMEEGYTQEALDRAELTPEQRTLLTAPVEVTVTGGQTGEGEAMGLLSMLLPFASLMLLYFLVLLYGQSTAASVILEKPPSSWTCSWCPWSRGPWCWVRCWPRPWRGFCSWPYGRRVWQVALPSAEPWSGRRG